MRRTYIKANENKFLIIFGKLLKCTSLAPRIFMYSHGQDLSVKVNSNPGSLIYHIGAESLGEEPENLMLKLTTEI